MASGENENPQRDQVPGPDEADLQPAEGAAPDQAEPTEAWFEPTEEVEPAEATPELAEPLPGLPEPTIAFEGLSADTEGAELFDGLPLEPAPEQSPGVAETVAFESLTPETLEGLLSVTPDGAPGEPSESAAAEGESPEVAAGETSPFDAGTVQFQTEVTEGAPAAESLAETTEGLAAAGGLLAGGLLGETIAAEGETATEGEAKAEEEAEKPAEEEAEKQPGALARLGVWIADTSVYNMLLVVALVALILGSLALLQELKSYNWDVKAREGKRPIAAAGADYGPASTTAIA